MANKLVYADQIFKDPMSISGDFLSGFNSRLMGETYGDTCGYPHPPYTIGNRVAGWQKADDMIRDGKIYYMHIFPHGDCKGHSFNYGGTHVCNTCGRKDIAAPWWNIRVMKDGNAWCVVGEGFINLKESENYAFGDTKEEALKNYQDLMLKKEAEQ